MALDMLRDPFPQIFASTTCHSDRIFGNDRGRSTAASFGPRGECFVRTNAPRRVRLASAQRFDGAMRPIPAPARCGFVAHDPEVSAKVAGCTRRKLSPRSALDNLSQESHRRHLRL
jgi:hypothetical protein